MTTTTTTTTTTISDVVYADLAEIKSIQAAPTDNRLAEVAADILLKAAHARLIAVSADGSEVNWPQDLYRGCRAANGAWGIRTSRRITAKIWLVKAYVAGLAPNVHIGPRVRSLGSLHDIRERFCCAERAPPTPARPAPLAPAPLTPSSYDDSRRALGGRYCLGDVREAVRLVAATRDNQEARDILNKVGGVFRCDALMAEHYDAVVDACKAAVRNEPQAHDDADRDLVVRPNPFAGVTAFEIEKWDGLGDALMGCNPTSGEIAVIGVFNDPARAEYIRDLLRAAR